LWLLILAFYPHHVGVFRRRKRRRLSQMLDLYPDLQVAVSILLTLTFPAAPGDGRIIEQGKVFGRG
jgi:hypothetical protein